MNVDLLELWNEQQGQCYITKVTLVPGKTASLDHVIPLSRGGENEKDNLKFAHIAINCMKQDLTLWEFKEELKTLVPLLQEFIKEK